MNRTLSTRIAHRVLVLSALIAIVPAPAQEQASAARGAFDLATAPPPPDYTLPAAWAALPDVPGRADTGPPNTHPPAPRAPIADVFYVHPTTDRSVARWNQPLNDATVNSETDRNAIARQATAFDLCCRIYAPRYRQASSGASSDRVNGPRAYALAYEDVRRAFRHYLDHSNRGRPFILAGHSQGALHIYQLLEDEIDRTAVADRLVAAYAIGVPIAEGAFGRRYQRVKPCTRASETGCVASWNTFVAGSDVSGFVSRSETSYATRYGTQEGRSLLCVNPLTFENARSRAPASLNAGSLGPSNSAGVLPALVPGRADAACVGGVLFVSAHGASVVAAPLPGGNLHVSDIDLFYANLRSNAALRSRAFARRR